MFGWLYYIWSDLCQWLTGAEEYQFDLRVEDLESRPDAKILTDEEIERCFLTQSVPNLMTDKDSSDENKALHSRSLSSSTGF